MTSFLYFDCGLLLTDMAAIPPPAAYSSDQQTSNNDDNKDNNTEEGSLKIHVFCDQPHPLCYSLTAVIPTISSALLKKAPKKITPFSSSGKLV